MVAINLLVVKEADVLTKVLQTFSILLEGSDSGRFAAFNGAISPLNALLVREEVEIVKITLKTLRLVAESATTMTLTHYKEILMESVVKLVKDGPG